ncbi:UPF0496 protein At4g34320, partial [Capsella rubella]|uniref:UPF0496 protein At4g34320 n=1 Tax=Capsella rubella TaxID=81985 RepID=UPI000CD5AE81
LSIFWLAGGNGYKKTLEELTKFQNAERPFGEDFLSMFQNIYKQQIIMLETIQVRKNKLDKKLKRVQTWRKLSSIIFVATYATVLICAVVAAAMFAPPLAATLVTAAVPMGAMGKWIDSMWKNYEKGLKGHKGVIESMEVSTTVALKDLDDIRSLIEKLDNDIKSMVKGAEDAVEFGAVKVRIIAIEKILSEFTKKVEELETRVDLCTRHATRARTVIIQRIINYPKKDSSKK